MTSILFHVGSQPNQIHVDLDLEQCCQKTGKRFLTAFKEHVYNKTPRPYVLAVTQDEQHEVRCFDGLGFSLAREREDSTKKATYKQIHYVCLKSLHDISLIKHAPEDVALAYAPFAYATILSAKVSSARQRLIDHYLLSKKPAEALELLQLNIEEYGEYIKDSKMLTLAGKLLCSGSTGIERDEVSSTEYFKMAVHIDPLNDEAKRLLSQMSPNLASPQTTSPQTISPQSTTSSQILLHQALTPLSEEVQPHDDLKPCSPEITPELKRAQSCPAVIVSETLDRVQNAANSNDTSSAVALLSKPDIEERSQSAPPLLHNKVSPYK